MTERAADAVVLPYWLGRPASDALVIAREADRLGYPELWLGVKQIKMMPCIFMEAMQQQ